MANKDKENLVFLVDVVIADKFDGTVEETVGVTPIKFSELKEGDYFVMAMPVEGTDDYRIHRQVVELPKGKDENGEMILSTRLISLLRAMSPPDGDSIDIQAIMAEEEGIKQIEEVVKKHLDSI